MKRFPAPKTRTFRKPKATVRVKFPLRKFISKLEKKEKRVLHRTGKYGLKTYRSRGGVGKKAPKEPQKYTKTGEVSKRFMNYQAKLRRVRMPYTKRGQLRNLSRYEVMPEFGDVMVGPTLFRTATQSTLTAPRLIDQGGSAVIRVGKKRPKRRTVTYRAYPFRSPIRDKVSPQFVKIMKQVKLR